MRVRHVALALIALGTGVLVHPASTDAASVSKSAWWYRTSQPTSVVPPAATPPAPLPDTPIEPVAPPVAEGTLLVEGTPEGATAVSALTYTLLEGESSPILTVTPDTPEQAPAESVILACRAAVDWTVPETQPGRWQDKPLIDCGRSVNGIRSEDGTWSWALGPLVSGNDVDVVLVPGVVGETPAGRIGSAFSLSFSAADGAVLTTTPPPFDGGPSGDGGSFSGGYTPPPSSTGGGTFTTPETPIVQPALEPQDQAPTVPDQPMASAPVAAVEDNDTAQGVGFLVLLAGLALAGWAYVTPARSDADTIGVGRFRRAMPTTSTDALAEPVTGGLGRFARPRTGPPPALG